MDAAFHFQLDNLAAEEYVNNIPLQDLDRLQEQMIEFQNLGSPTTTPTTVIGDRMTLHTSCQNRQHPSGRSAEMPIPPTDSSLSAVKVVAKRQHREPGLEAGASNKRAKTENVKRELFITAVPKGTRRKVKSEVENTLTAERRWSDLETTKLLLAILGPDADDLYEKMKTNPGYVYSKVSAVTFNGERPNKAIKSKYVRLKRIYQCILEFEMHTGNGGGDGDEDGAGDIEDDKRLEDRIKKAVSAGKQCAKLTAKILNEWREKGWYDLFNNRLNKHPALVREVEHHAQDISDFELNHGSYQEVDSEDKYTGNSTCTKKTSDTEDIDDSRSSTSASLCTSQIKRKTPTSKGVPEPRFKKRSPISMADGAADFFSANTEFMKASIKAESDRVLLMERRETRADKEHQLKGEEHSLKMCRETANLERETKRDARNAQEARVRMAQAVLSGGEGVSVKIKDAAEAVLLKFFEL